MWVKCEAWSLRDDMWTFTVSNVSGEVYWQPESMISPLRLAQALTNALTRNPYSDRNQISCDGTGIDVRREDLGEMSD